VILNTTYVETDRKLFDVCGLSFKERQSK